MAIPYIITCNNRPVTTNQHIQNCVIHDLSDGKGLAHHRNVVMNEAYARGEKEIWMLDDDITGVFKKGLPRFSKKTGKPYPSKEKIFLNLDEIDFPKGTAVGGLSKSIYPFGEKAGFADVLGCVTQIIYINLEIFDGWNMPTEPVGEIPDDGIIVAYAFHKKWMVKKSLDYSFVCNNSVTEFSEKRVALWYKQLEILRDYDGFGADPRIRKSWKQTLNYGPWQDPNGKNSKNMYKDELIRRGLWID